MSFENYVENIYIGEHTLDKGIIGYRPLQDNLSDISGNGYNGTRAKGSGQFVTEANKTGAKMTVQNATSYSRADNYVILNLYHNTCPISFGCRVYRYSRGDNWNIMGNGLGISSQNNFKIGGWNQRLDYGYGTGYYSSGSAEMNLNVRVHIVVTVESGKSYLYVNGEKVYEQNLGGNGSNATNRTLGAGDYASFQSWLLGMDGLMRHAIIYDRVLSANEVKQLYEQTI